ncbi:Pentatricopeptide repeat-containing protein At4g14850 [Linum perenne]
MGRRIQGQIFRHGFDSDVFVQNGLVTFYAKRGEIELANKVFGRLSDKTIVTWTSMISGYAQNGSIADAGKLFDEMPERNIVTWNAYISNAVLDGSIADAGKLFDEMPERNIVTWNAYIYMYGNCGSIHDAEQTFREMPEKNLFAWNAMISGYAHQGHADMAIRLFREMASVVAPNYVTFVCVLSACSRGGPAELILRLAPSHSVVTWTSLISGCVQNGHFSSALRLFFNMRREDILPSSALVDMYGKCESIHDAEQTFREMPEKNLFAWNAMISGYGKCKEVGLAEMVFDGMERRNLVTWGSMVATYEQNGEKEKACIAFMKCRKLGIEPTDYVISSVVSACAELAGIELGRSVHALAVNSCVDADVYVGSALVDMYGKCGSIHDAEQTFREMPEKNLFAWNAMISGYAHQGHADMAIGLFREMASVVAPNYVTFVCVLSACSRGGAVETGMDVYESMMKKYGIEAGPEHYACVVDMLARSGLVERAYDFVQKLPIRPTISIWGALLNACRVHGKPEIGKIAADNLFELDPKDSGNHVLLSNMFAVAGR